MSLGRAQGKAKKGRFTGGMKLRVQGGSQGALLGEGATRERVNLQVRGRLPPDPSQLLGDGRRRGNFKRGFTNFLRPSSTKKLG